MSDKGPFDAAIKIIEDNSGWVRDAGGKLQYPPEIETAIRVLEVAGKVDKEEALISLCDAGNGLAYGKLGMEQARALLQSLPDKEEKRK